MDKPAISFFCPAYNDELNIEKVVRAANNLLQEVASAYEIIVIEDCSPDKTAAVVDELAQKYPNVKVIHHEKNRGYGGALKSGFAQARYDVVMYTDGDFQFDLQEFKKMLPHLQEYDVVVGRRKNRAEPITRKIQSFVYNSLGRMFLHLPFKDMNCAMKIFKKKALEQITIESSTVFICMEMLSKLKDKGFTIKEVEVTHYPRLHGEASGAKWIVVSRTFRDFAKYSFSRYFP